MHCSFTEIFTVIFWAFAAGFLSAWVLLIFLTSLNAFKSRKKFKEDKQAFLDKHKKT